MLRMRCIGKWPFASLEYDLQDTIAWRHASLLDPATFPSFVEKEFSLIDEGQPSYEGWMFSMNRQHALGMVGAGLATVLTSTPVRAASALRIATLPIDGTALAYYAKDLNYFQDAGLDVTIQNISNGGAVTAAVLSNSVDIGWSNIISLAAAYKRGLPVVIIGAGGIHTPGSLATQLMVRKDSPLRTASDLSGKVIGCTGLANIPQFATELWIDKNGGKSSTVKFIEVPLPQLPAALEQSRVDAAWLAEPFINASQAFARTFATCFDAVAPRWMLGAWFTTPAWAKANHDVVESFRTVMAKTATWANANQTQSAAILAKYSSLDPNLMKNMHRTTYGTRPEIAQIQPVIELSARYGAIDATFPAQEIMYSP
jgi:NitT/TauT family transport system substrate-binding protein